MKFYTVLHTKQNENYQLYQYQRADFSYQQRRQKSSNSKAACPSFCSNTPRGFTNSYSIKVSSSMQRIPKTSCSHKVSPIYISSSVLKQQYALKACIIFRRAASTASLNLNMRRVEKLQPCIKMNLYHWWHLHLEVKSPRGSTNTKTQLTSFQAIGSVRNRELVNSTESRFL